MQVDLLNEPRQSQVPHPYPCPWNLDSAYNPHSTCFKGTALREQDPIEAICIEDMIEAN